jgi:RNA polymerase sigma-70 factor (ECF subfamily)
MEAARAAALDEATDQEIVREVRAGAFARFEVLVRRHSGRARHAVRSILRNERDVEDAVQQALLQAFVGLRTFDGAASFATWLSRIALNEALMRARRARREARPAWAVLDGVASPAAPPDEAAASREALAQVRRGIARLPASHREVLRLRHVEGLPIAEVAARLGISEGAAKLRLHRARLVLRRTIGEGAAGQPERRWTGGDRP